MKDPKLYLIQILECLQRIESYTAIGKDAFMRESMIQDVEHDAGQLREKLEAILAGLG